MGEGKAVVAKRQTQDGKRIAVLRTMTVSMVTTAAQPAPTGERRAPRVRAAPPSASPAACRPGNTGPRRSAACRRRTSGSWTSAAEAPQLNIERSRCATSVSAAPRGSRGTCRATRTRNTLRTQKSLVDLATMLLWAKDMQCTGTWQAALSSCENLSYESFGDRRLPGVIRRCAAGAPSPHPAYQPHRRDRRRLGSQHMLAQQHAREPRSLG